LRRYLKLAAPLTVIGLAVAVVAGLHATRPVPAETAEKSENRAAALAVERVRREPVTLTVETHGEVEPVTEIDLVAEVSGRIVSVSPSFATGGTVAAGETLVRIEPDNYRFAVTRAEAQVAQARLALAQQEAGAEIAERQWRWEDVKETPTPLALKQPHVAEARAALAAAEAELAQARRDLERTRITVPFKGRVRSKDADLGQYVTAGAVLGRVFSTEAAQVRLPLTDRQLAEADLPIAYSVATRTEGRPVRLRAEFAGQMRQWTGYIVRTAAAVDRETRLFHAIAEVPDPFGAGAADGGVPLPVGLFVNAEIPGRELAGAYVFPRAALRGERQVYVVADGDTLSIREVDVIAADDDRVVARSGVEDGERVVVSPLREAREGMAVTALDRDRTDRLARAGEE